MKNIKGRDICVDLRWLRDAAAMNTIASLIFACAGYWQIAVGGFAATWIIYWDARILTRSHNKIKEQNERN